MREILFRGKRIDTRGWIEGSFLKGYNGRSISIIIDHEEGIASQGSDCVTDGSHQVDPSTVGQYTELTDNNGKKIFEGDILGIPKYPRHIRYAAGQLPAVVVFGNGEFSLVSVDGDKESLKENIMDVACGGNQMIVIGNIYDNPELFKA